MVGGGQERGLRPGTLPVHLIAGLGEAARLAANELKKRTARCLDLKAQVMECFTGIPYQINGHPRSNRCIHPEYISDRNRRRGRYSLPQGCSGHLEWRGVHLCIVRNQPRPSSHETRRTQNTKQPPLVMVPYDPGYPDR